MERDLQLLQDRASWDEAIDEILTGRGVRTVFQPIVDVEHGHVVGYEALSRFDSPIEATPDRWFAEAASRGLGERLEAVTLATALRARADLPPGCFLSVNVGPEALAGPEVQQVLEDEGDLEGIVIELTEHTQVDSYPHLLGTLERCRSQGALIAIDDAGAGYAGLQHIMAVRPSILKLDRSLIADLDRDDVKRSLVEMLSGLAHRMGARVVAEGVERLEELGALQSIGISLAQGFYFAIPTPGLVQLGLEARAACATTRCRRGGATLRSAMEIIAWVEEHNLAHHPARELAVVIAGNRRPVGFVDPAEPDYIVDARCISPDASFADAAALAMERPDSERLRPLVCVDSAGRYLGVARVERIIERLARQAV